MNDCLIVVDMLKDFINPDGALTIGPPGQEVVPGIKKRLEAYREKGLPVIFVCDHHEPEDKEFRMFPPHAVGGEEGSEIVADLTPQPGEKIVLKRRFDGFFGTDLDLTLREKNIKNIEIAGVLTNICVLYTAAQARMLNYEVFVVPKLVASNDEEVHKFALQEMEKTLGVEIGEDA